MSVSSYQRKKKKTLVRPKHYGERSTTLLSCESKWVVTYRTWASVSSASVIVNCYRGN